MCCFVRKLSLGMLHSQNPACMSVNLEPQDKLMKFIVLIICFKQNMGDGDYYGEEKNTFDFVRESERYK